ncbi:uncharacterized protein K460DRAFT_401900 [Cucurbitaria berberidis CBS 394.84]|uniref:Uncharacterized protein n=1 Tax=Cucurbitaria berberidis CBS 394.84 TaxID=1168544 RepID=A0A9P4LEC4_9PLEO|nr:uncharacterized protein K460DRAFT_401900 [Cucurbitaria berberidis CBS 394.84]KAF1851900.1 hypothetical protein K460DRAFT_401900 [Cucurbitaria berberidis CBS 394.84]
MHFPSALTLVSGLALMALPSVSAIENAAAFTTWSVAGCDKGTRTEFQNIPSDVCGFLPGVSFKLWFLQNPPQCQFRAYRSSDCSGPYDTYTRNDISVCKDITQRSSYKVVC